MLDEIPKDMHDDAGWFRHFRMTKYLPAISGKYDAATKMTEDDATATKAVMTAYSAAAIDILMFTSIPPKNFAADLAETFRLTPQHLLLLQVDDFSRLAQRSTITVSEKLAEAGFLLDKGTVVGFRLPADAQRPKRPQPPPQP